jgi:lysophospholipase L1-like esterase
MSPKIKNFFKNGALFMGTLFLCFLALELALKLAGYGNVEIYEPDPLLYWRNAPNQNAWTTVERKRFRTNSKYTRGPEFSEVKPPNTLRIMTLGDSRTFGWGLADDETWSALLEKYLQEKIGSSRKVEVINAGVNSWSFAQMNIYFREIGVKYQPDFVLLGDANLWTQFSEKNSPEFVRSFMRRVAIKNFLRRFATYHYILEIKLRDAYDKYRARFIPVDPKHDTLFKDQQQKDPASFFEHSIEEFCQTALTNKVQPVVLFFPIVPDLQDKSKSWAWQAKTKVCERMNVPLVDLTPVIAPKGESIYLKDPVHFTVEGNIIIAKTVTDAIYKLLK